MELRICLERNENETYVSANIVVVEKLVIVCFASLQCFDCVLHVWIAFELPKTHLKCRFWMFICFIFFMADILDHFLLKLDFGNFPHILTLSLFESVLYKFYLVLSYDR